MHTDPGERRNVEDSSRYSPTIVMKDGEYEVVAMSEYEVRFRTHYPGVFVLGETINCTLRVVPGDALALRGEVGGLHKSAVSIFLSGSVPMEKIRTCQRHLRDQYRVAEVNR